MLRLRTSLGIFREEYERMFLLPFDPLEQVLRRHEAYYHTAQDGDGRWFLTAKGFLTSNDIISDLLIAQDESTPLKKI